MIKALTFDLFGTILDLEKSTYPSIKNILDNNKSSVTPQEFWAFLRHRQRIEQLFNDASDALNEEDFNATIDLYVLSYNSREKLISPPALITRNLKNYLNQFRM